MLRPKHHLNTCSELQTKLLFRDVWTPPWIYLNGNKGQKQHWALVFYIKNKNNYLKICFRNQKSWFSTLECQLVFFFHQSPSSLNFQITSVGQCVNKAIVNALVGSLQKIPVILGLKVSIRTTLYTTLRGAPKLTLLLLLLHLTDSTPH